MGVLNSTVHLVDVRNKMVAGTFTLQNVTAVVPARDSLLVVTGAGHISVLKEVCAWHSYVGCLSKQLDCSHDVQLAILLKC